jgi:hypothetical protein
MPVRAKKTCQNNNLELWFRFNQNRSAQQAIEAGALIKPHAYALCLAPNDSAGPLASVDIDEQRELIGDADRTDHLQRRARMREVAKSARNSASAELDRSGLQHPLPLFASMLTHRLYGVPKKLTAGNEPRNCCAWSAGPGVFANLFDHHPTRLKQWVCN